MAFFSIPNIHIAGVASAVPEILADNLDLDLMERDEKTAFIRKVGIRMRRIAPKSVCASDLCISAAEQLLALRNETSKDIGALVFVTQTPDFLLPGNSMLAQKRLGLPASTYLIDLNQGCAGYVYGLAALSGMMHAARIRKGLLLVGDTITRLISPEDKSTLPIFSDAGSATLLESSAPRAAGDLMFFNLGADGRGANAIQMLDGGARSPFNEASLQMQDVHPGIRRAPAHLVMEGIDVLQYSFRYVVPNILEILEAAGWSIDDPDYYVFHQANRLLNEGLARKLGLKPEKIPYSLEDFGNTSCATIPVTLNSRLGSTLSKGRYKLLLSGFGVGFSWGSALVQVDSITCPDVIHPQQMDSLRPGIDC
jgi:3-oxoacyl-[acyl-carrier-protein] synthase-3